METPSLAALALMTMCFAACDSGSAPPQNQPKLPSPAAEAPPSAELEEPPSATDGKQPAPSPATESKQPPSSSGRGSKQPPSSSGTAGTPPPRGTPPQPQPPQSPPPQPAPPTKAEQPGGRSETAQSFSVYALSRGSGVPPAAREVQQKVQELVESDRSRGVEVTVRATRLGLEGERKLCVTYVDAQEAARALERVRALAQGVELVNVVVEPCKKP